jgi:hypothetical protein
MDAAIDHVEDEHSVPLLPLGRMDRDLRRIQGQLAEKARTG